MVIGIIFECSVWVHINGFVDCWDSSMSSAVSHWWSLLPLIFWEILIWLSPWQVTNHQSMISLQVPSLSPQCCCLYCWDCSWWISYLPDRWKRAKPGISYSKTMRKIILLKRLNSCFQTLSTNSVIALKDTTIVSAIGLSSSSRLVRDYHRSKLPKFQADVCVLAVFYLVITLLLDTLLQNN